MNVYFYFVVLLLTVSSVAGCGYSSQPLYRYNPRTTSIAIPIFENRTRWRELETELTNSVVERVTAQTPYRLTDAGQADLILRGEITGFSKPTLSEDPLDAVVRSSVRYNINVKVIEPSTEKVLQSRSRSFSAAFAGDRQETPASARREAEEKIGKWIVRILEQNRW